MTYDCNCCCNYCFENLNNHTTGKSTDSQKLIEYLQNLIKEEKIKRIILHFFGGEPLLRISEIVKIAESLNNLDIEILYNVITNGVFLSLDNIEKLYKRGIRNYQITLDGVKELHDTRRPCKDKNISCYTAIMNNLKNIENSDWANKVEISIRINIDDENVSQIADIYKELPQFITSKNSPHQIYIAPVVGICSSSFSTTMNQRTKTVITAWKTIHNQKLNISITPPKYAPCPFHSENAAFYIDLNGNI